VRSFPQGSFPNNTKIQISNVQNGNHEEHEEKIKNSGAKSQNPESPPSPHPSPLRGEGASLVYIFSFHSTFDIGRWMFTLLNKI